MSEDYADQPEAPMRRVTGAHAERTADGIVKTEADKGARLLAEALSDPEWLRLGREGIARAEARRRAVEGQEPDPMAASRERAALIALEDAAAGPVNGNHAPVDLSMPRVTVEEANREVAAMIQERDEDEAVDDPAGDLFKPPERQRDPDEAAEGVTLAERAGITEEELDADTSVLAEHDRAIPRPSKTGIHAGSWARRRALLAWFDENSPATPLRAGYALGYERIKLAAEDGKWLKRQGLLYATGRSVFDWPGGGAGKAGIELTAHPGAPLPPPPEPDVRRDRNGRGMKGTTNVRGVEAHRDHTGGAVGPAAPTYTTEGTSMTTPNGHTSTPTQEAAPSGYGAFGPMTAGDLEELLDAWAGDIKLAEATADTVALYARVRGEIERRNTELSR